MTLNRLIGSGPDQVSVNGMLGDLAFQNADNVSLGRVLTSGDITLDDGAGTFLTTLQTITPTANRTISLPDATGTVALVAGSSGQLVWNSAGAQAGVPGSVVGATGDLTLALNGAASTPPLEVTGTWFTGGTATTTKPQVLVEPAGTTSTAWSTAGTGLGVNAASGFVGRLLDLQLNGTSNFNVDSTGRVSVPLGTAALPALYPGTDTNTGVWSPAADTLAASTNGTERLRIDSSGRLLVGSTTSGTSLLQVVAQASANGNSFKSVHSFADTGTGLSQTGTAAPYISALYGFNAGMQATAIAINSVDFASGDCGLQLEFNCFKGGGTVSNGDRFGRITFGGQGAGNLSPGASIAAFADNTPGASDMPGRLVFSTTSDGASVPTERLRITSTGRVGIGTTTPGYLLDVGGADQTVPTINCFGPAADNNWAGGIRFASNNGTTVNSKIQATTGGLFFEYGGSERARIDSSGKLLVGTSTARNDFYNATTGNGTLLQTEGTGLSSQTYMLQSWIVNHNSATVAPHLVIGKSRGSTNGSVTIVQSGDSLGHFDWHGADGNDMVMAASIDCAVDGTPGSNDMPGRLIFLTTADGASTPTERLRITSTGQVRLAGAGITFNGDTATANELDDYEEGVWTPTLRDGLGGTGTLSEAYGKYTKIGRSVFVQVHTTISSTSGLTGSQYLYIGGAPFTCASNNATNLSCPNFSGVPFSGYTVTVIGNAEAAFSFSKVTSNASSTPHLVSDFGAGDVIQFSGWYMV